MKFQARLPTTKTDSSTDAYAVAAAAAACLLQFCAFPGDVSMAPCDVNDAAQRWTCRTPPARESIA
jgi:hypothetical protein